MFGQGVSLDLSRRALVHLMAALVKINLLHLSSKRYPPIYHSGVVYERESGERWQDVPTLIRGGVGDCEDLACWRVAELMNAGVSASPYLRWADNVNGVHHALVRLPDGRIEDPSLSLGMRGSITSGPLYV